MSSTASLEEKRTRGGSEDGGELFEVPDMTKDLNIGKQLKKVLHKLEKLDTIESCLNNVCSTITNIEQTLSQLDHGTKKLKEKVKARVSGTMTSQISRRTLKRPNWS